MSSIQVGLSVAATYQYKRPFPPLHDWQFLCKQTLQCDGQGSWVKLYVPLATTPTGSGERGLQGWLGLLITLNLGQGSQTLTSTTGDFVFLGVNLGLLGSFLRCPSSSQGAEPRPRVTLTCPLKVELLGMQVEAESMPVGVPTPVRLIIVMSQLVSKKLWPRVVAETLRYMYPLIFYYNRRHEHSISSTPRTNYPIRR